MPVSFQQKIKFRNIPEERLDEFNFIGGWVEDVHETKLDPSQSPNVSNVLYNNTGSVKTRPGYARYNGDATGAAADQSNTGASTGSLAIDAVGDYVAQTFQASGEIYTTQIDVYLAVQTSGQEQYVRVEVWETSSGTPTAILNDDAKSQIKLISGTSETAYNFRFRKPLNLEASTTYAVVVKPYVASTTQTVNQVNVYHRGTTYANGQVYTSVNSGIAWTGDSAKDLRFVVYGGGNTGATGFLRYYGDNSIQQTFVKFGNSLYRGDDQTGALTAITQGSGTALIAANYIDYTISNGTLLVVDDSGYIQKYRGSTNANYTTGTIAVTSSSATVTGTGTSWNTNTNATEGEYIKLPDGKWYRITAIGSDTSLTVETTYLGSTVSGQTYTISPWGEVQGDLNSATVPSSLVRPTPTFIENHLNRIWTAEGNTLRFSVLDTSVTGEHFNDWDSSNNAGAIVIPTGKGDTITGLYSANGYLYVLQRNAIWEIFGNSPSNFELRNISNEIGCANRRTIVEYEKYIIFLSAKGICLFDGANPKIITEGRINNAIHSWANQTSTAAVLWDNKYVLSYTPSAGGTNSEVVFYDIARDIFGRFTNVYANMWCAWNGGTDTGQVYFASSNQGSIYLWDTGLNDDGYEIDTLYDTPSLGIDVNTNDKAIKKFVLQQVAQGDYTMEAIMYSDLSNDGTSSEINLSTGSSSLWDVAEWGVGEWTGEGQLITTRVAEFQGIAKYFKFRFQQSGFNTPIEVLGLTLTQRVRRLA